MTVLDASLLQDNLYFIKVKKVDLKIKPISGNKEFVVV